MKNYKTLLNYKLIEKIGESGHAEIYKAKKQNNPEYIYVLKIIKQGVASKHRLFNIRSIFE